ncbi:MAG: rhomboid family intramembrane serine protease [Spirochaetia bacterium]|nr:rhomboid family intramembrane serine protease [Spirochaetia bacterium]
MQERSPDRKPVVTIFIIALNVAVYAVLNLVLIFIYDYYYVEDLYRTFGLIPHDFWNGAWWQPITSMFLHGNPAVPFFPLIHLFVNMTALWSLGMPLERTIGSSRYAWLYFISGAASSLFVVLSSLFMDEQIYGMTVGASGAVLGVLGGMAIFYPNSMVLLFFIPMRLRTAAIGFVIFSITAQVFGFFEMISHMGHLGGLLGGILYTKFVIGSEIGFSEIHQKAPLQKRFMKIIVKNKGQDSFFDHLSGRQKEKEINPRSDAGAKQDFHKSDELKKSKGKLYYDPETGEFYIKED